MYRLKFKLFELFEIPVYLDLTFALILFMFLQSGTTFEAGLIEALVLAFSIVAHEFAHALTGRAFGCETHDITLSFIGGCASMVSMPRRGYQEFLVALAGPLMSFALSGLGFVCLLLLPTENYFLFMHLLACLMWMNLVLGCFNLLPGFPMDGGRIFRSVMLLFVSRPQATLIAMWVGRVFAVLLGLSGVYYLFNGGSWAFLRIFIAIMIWKDGYREYQLAQMEASWSYADFRAKVSPPPYERDDY